MSLKTRLLAIGFVYNVVIEAAKLFHLALSRTHATEIVGTDMKLKENWHHWTAEHLRTFCALVLKEKAIRREQKLLACSRACHRCSTWVVEPE
jgi:hypothetical protein